jgi:hypothetical protein
MKTRLFIALQFLFLVSFAQNPLNYLASTKGGSCYEVCYNNGYLYAGCANTLMVFPTNGPNYTPGAATDSIRLLSNIDYITARNGFLYVCANHDGLWKFDLNNPAQPAAVAHYKPAAPNESIYDVAFYGDSLLVAAKTKVNLLKDNGSSFTLLGTVATYTGTTTRVRGVDIKDTLLAFTVGYSASNSQDGVYVYSLETLQQLGYYHDTQGDPQDVCFGQNTTFLHVMGGTLPNLIDGQYYALDYSVLPTLSVAFTQTISGYGAVGSISQPMNGKLINDTLYISTQGAVEPGYSGSTPLTCQIYVYDAHGSNISYLTSIYGGLYHFDCDINPATRTMYVASEWYGVLTLDVSDIYSEFQKKRTNTGGWCHGSAQAKNKLAEASEGFGLRLFDVTNMQSPVYIAEDTTRGFCRAISISDSADYVYAWFLTGAKLRVRSGNNLSFVKDTTGNLLFPSDFKKSRYHNGKLAVIEEYGLLGGSHNILSADVSNPLQASITAVRNKNNVVDLAYHSGGDLMALANDSLLVLDAATLATLTSIKPPLGGLQPYKALAISNDTIYVLYQGVGAGIARYLYNPGLHTLSYLSALPLATASNRIHLACDNSLLYVSGTLDSLKAVTKASLTKLSVYDHGADFVLDNLWGNTDLYYRKGYLFLNEYMGQTSIFGPSNTTAMQVAFEKNMLSVYPNPATDYFTINTGTKEECMVSIYDSQGRLMYVADVRAEKFVLGTSGFHRGMYFVIVNTNGKEKSSKLLIEK